jgi:DNA-binding transcriptional MerR regulator
MRKSADAFRTISEVSAWLDTPTHVLRFWESKFSQIKPVKRAGGRRYYRPEDMMLLGGIKKLLHNDGITIKGVNKILKEQGVKHVSSLSPDIDTSTSQTEKSKPVEDISAADEVSVTHDVNVPIVDTPPDADQDAEPMKLEPLQLTPSDAASSDDIAAYQQPMDTEIEDGNFTAEDTPWAKKPAPDAVTPPEETPIAPAGEYVRRFGLIADDAEPAPSQLDVTGTPEQDAIQSTGDLGHLRPGPVSHFKYRDRSLVPIYPKRAYSSDTLDGIRAISQKLGALGA